MVDQHAQGISHNDALSDDSIQAIARAVVEAQSHVKRSRVDNAPENAHAMAANAHVDAVGVLSGVPTSPKLGDCAPIALLKAVRYLPLVLA